LIEAAVEGGEMGKVVVVTSGKGGVGKTTSTAALGVRPVQAWLEGNAPMMAAFD